MEIKEGMLYKRKGINDGLIFTCIGVSRLGVWIKTDKFKYYINQVPADDFLRDYERYFNSYDVGL